MQKLQFEAKWDKALPAKDREKVQAVFENTKGRESDMVEYTPLWNAANYKGDLLATVLVQNFSDETITFEEKALSFYQNGYRIATENFSVPRLAVAPRTSTPWAFIFPEHTLEAPFDVNVNGMLKEENT